TGLGDPNNDGNDGLYESHMALVRANSYWICDRCFSLSEGRPRTTHIPLPAMLSGHHSNDNDGSNGSDNNEKNYCNTWNFCHPCCLKNRRSSDANDPFIINPYDGYPSLIRLLPSPLTQKRYFLTPAHLWRINTCSWINSDGRNGEDIYLYSEGKILALEVHGGWSGLKRESYLS
ncbi:hypothetical protein BGX23_002476, partial [Mortierella sp. AD031]